MALRLAKSSAPVAKPAARAVRVVRPSVAMRTMPDKSAVETAVKIAEDACKDGKAGECAAAWDNVEEISAAIAHEKAKESTSQDPLDKFCDDNPDADECRIYDD